MSRTNRVAAAFAAALALIGAGAGPVSAHGSRDEGRSSVLIFQNTNPAGPNAIQVYEQTADGGLIATDLVPTGGVGSGDSLGNQGGVVRDGRWLFAVNAGDDTVSTFRIDADGLTAVDVEPSGGDRPISIATHDDLVYVVNAGNDMISGFRLGRRGDLTPLPRSARPLSGVGVGAAQISFTPDGEFLVVTEKTTNKIVTFRVGRRGYVGEPTVSDSIGAVPFGFDFDRRGHLVVSEAAPAALSSYEVGRSGVSVITAGLPDTQAAACWVEVTRDGRYAFTTNAASATISSYAIGRDGTLTLLAAVAATTGAGPTDMAESADGASLFVRVRDGSIESYAIGRDGSLTFTGSASGAPAAGTSGLAAR